MYIYYIVRSKWDIGLVDNRVEIFNNTILVGMIIIHSSKFALCYVHFRNLVLFREKKFQYNSRDVNRYFIEVAFPGKLILKYLVLFDENCRRIKFYLLIFDMII